MSLADGEWLENTFTTGLPYMDLNEGLSVSRKIPSLFRQRQ